MNSGELSDANQFSCSTPRTLPEKNTRDGYFYLLVSKIQTSPEN